MLRLLGILLGSAIAVAVLIMLVGIPQISSQNDPEPVTVQLPLTASPLKEEAAPPPAQPAEPVAAVALAPAPDAVDDTAPEPDPVPPPAPVVEQQPAEALPDEAQRWYAFWSPFRSQIAANGFVAQLQRVTGLDYRVVSVKPGVYEVAFAYSDDDEIQANLSQISAATGLDIPES